MASSGDGRALNASRCASESSEATKLRRLCRAIRRNSCLSVNSKCLIAEGGGVAGPPRPFAGISSDASTSGGNHVRRTRVRSGTAPLDVISPQGCSQKLVPGSTRRHQSRMRMRPEQVSLPGFRSARPAFQSPGPVLHHPRRDPVRPGVRRLHASDH